MIVKVIRIIRWNSLCALFTKTKAHFHQYLSGPFISLAVLEGLLLCAPYIAGQ